MAVALGGLVIAISWQIGEAFEPLAGERYQFWHRCKVPVGVEDLGVAHVGRQRQHRPIDIGTLGMPDHHTAHGKGMAPIAKQELASNIGCWIIS